MKPIVKDSYQSYYGAVLVFKSSSDNLDYQPLYEEEVCLVEASSEDEAKECAIQIGKSRETSYKNQYGHVINLHFEYLLDVQSMQGLPGHGSTVYSRHFRDYSAYEKFEPLLNGQAL
jgi:hypothetical protein